MAAALAVMAFAAPAALATAPNMVVTDVVVNDPGAPSAFVTFTNEGDASAQIDSLTFAGDGLWFSGRDHDECSGTTVGIDGSCTIHVTGGAEWLTFAFLTGPSQDVYVDIQ